MRYYFLITVFIGHFSLINASFSQVSFKVTEVINGFIGLLGYGYNGVVSSDGNSKLMKENEDFVKETIKELGFNGKNNIYRLPQRYPRITSGLCFGNYIYVEESMFERFKEKPQVIRFLIAHEVKHIEKLHAIKSLGFFLLFFIFLQSKPGKRLGKEIDKKCVAPLINSNKYPITTNLTAFSVGVGISNYVLWPLLAFYSRSREKEADCEAFREMIKRYGYADAISAVKIFFAGSSNVKPSLWSYLWRSHPLDEERIQYLEKLGDELLCQSSNEKCGSVSE